MIEMIRPRDKYRMAELSVSEYRTPLSRLEYYVLFDHKARWANDSAAFVLALFWCAGRRFFLGASDERAFVESLFVATICVTVTTLSYCLKTKKEQKRKFSYAAANLRIRGLIPGVAIIIVTIILIGCVGLTLPVLEARILDSRLKGTLSKPLTEDTIGKARQIVQDAQEHNLRADPILVSQLGRQLLIYSAKNPQVAAYGLQAASAFASYRSNLVPPVKYQVIEGINQATGLDVAITGIGPNSKDPAFWRMVDGSFLPNEQNFQRIVFRVIHERGQVLLDKQEIRNITLVNAKIVYAGGPLTLASVQFVQCDFKVTRTNQNTRQLIAAALGGEPVTLEVK